MYLNIVNNIFLIHKIKDLNAPFSYNQIEALLQLIMF